MKSVGPLDALRPARPTGIENNRHRGNAVSVTGPAGVEAAPNGLRRVPPPSRPGSTMSVHGDTSLGVLERRPAYRDGAVVVAHEDVELAQLAQPTRRVAPDEQCLVVGVGVALGTAVTEHREDRGQELVRGGADRTLVAPSHHQRFVVRPETGSCGSERQRARTLYEHCTQRLGPAPSASAVELAHAAGDFQGSSTLRRVVDAGRRPQLVRVERSLLGRLGKMIAWAMSSSSG